jgi:hypothetical protein
MTNNGFIIALFLSFYTRLVEVGHTDGEDSTRFE